MIPIMWLLLFLTMSGDGSYVSSIVFTKHGNVSHVTSIILRKPDDASHVTRHCFYKAMLVSGLPYINDGYMTDITLPCEIKGGDMIGIIMSC